MISILSTKFLSQHNVNQRLIFGFVGYKFFKMHGLLSLLLVTENLIKFCEILQIGEKIADFEYYIYIAVIFVLLNLRCLSLNEDNLIIWK